MKFNKKDPQSKTSICSGNKGIVYWIDDDNNVYDNQDIFQNKDNPKIIAKYTKTKNIDGSLTYNIPSLFKN